MEKQKVLRQIKVERNQAESAQVPPNTNKLAVAGRGADRTQPKGTNESDSTTPKQSEKERRKASETKSNTKVFL